MQTIKNAVSDRFFRLVHTSRLIYNTCWEDPAIDRRLLEMNADSRVVMITSAGCNALDYLLDNPAEIHAVDVNSRQNALLNLKIAMIERGRRDAFMEMFGKGVHPLYREIYREVRDALPAQAKNFWDRKIAYFRPENGLRSSFYFHGTSGLVAWFFRFYLQWMKKKAFSFIPALLDAETLAEQATVYAKIEAVIWDGFNSWLVRQPALMSLVGVPRAQVRLIAETYPGGLSRYIKDKLRHVFTTVPIRENYFWRVYLTGAYTDTCRPNYLKPENFDVLRNRIGRLKLYTRTLSEFLRQNPGLYTHFILLDHQDWMAGHAPEALAEEWDLILANSRPGAKVLFRSAGMDHGFLPGNAKSSLRFKPRLTEALHVLDRVGTYGSLHFAEVVG